MNEQSVTAIRQANRMLDTAIADMTAGLQSFVASAPAEFVLKVCDGVPEWRRPIEMYLVTQSNVSGFVKSLVSTCKHMREHHNMNSDRDLSVAFLGTYRRIPPTMSALLGLAEEAAALEAEHVPPQGRVMPNELAMLHDAVSKSIGMLDEYKARMVRLFGEEVLEDE